MQHLVLHLSLQHPSSLRTSINLM